ncbi:MAG: glycosyltransferase [Phycisphaerae bacterium]|nr:glycosyltransferase [Phycisphaerae bacterium]
MKIAVVGHNLRVAGGLSVGQNVVSALGRIADEHDYYFILPAGVGYENIAKPSRSSCYYYQRKMGSVGQLLFTEFQLPRLVRAAKPDVIWALGNFGIPNPGVPQAILIQQAYLLYDPKEQKKPTWRISPEIQYVKRCLRNSLPGTKLVFCQTQTMAGRFRKEFAELLNGAEVGVMPNAVSASIHSTEAAIPPAIRDRADRFILFALTRYYAHKNLEALVDTFVEHREALRGVTLLLTIAAEQAPAAAAILKRIQDEKLEESIVNVGPLPQSELASYYNHSGALILPTLLESFSGTYVEAMRLNCPILTSDMDFAREICGPAAIYFDPWSTADIRDAILRLKGGGGELREKLVAAGRSQLASMPNKWDDIVGDAIGRVTALAKPRAHATRAIPIGGGAIVGGGSA